MNTTTELLTQNDVAKILKISSRTLEAWRIKGYGPEYKKISPRCVRYTRSAVDAFIEEKTFTSTSNENVSPLFN